MTGQPVLCRPALIASNRDLAQKSGDLEMVKRFCPDNFFTGSEKVQIFMWWKKLSCERRLSSSELADMLFSDSFSEVTEVVMARHAYGPQCCRNEHLSSPPLRPQFSEDSETVAIQCITHSIVPSQFADLISAGSPFRGFLVVCLLNLKVSCAIFIFHTIISRKAPQYAKIWPRFAQIAHTEK
jgi:hypothetical protein